MQLKKVYSNIIPFRGYLAMTVFPFIFVRKSAQARFTPKVERHETTHALQQLECLWVVFFLWYLLEWLIKIPFCHFNFHRAYRSISFEQEAYLWEQDAYYNKLRPHYSWRYFVFRLYNK